ncbi:carbohydrate kinase family protein [Candidatus Peregrinibacteria bacterium]|jgi:adenosine kinase|nr:carbohydrate kinase family protein [Candidatus Peregrinibacteria bacterium]
MTVLLTGSLAYDIIMTHNGKFSDNLIGGKLDDLNVAFLIDSKEKEFGGCGGNIAFNLSLLGEEVDLIGRAGRDFADYEEWLTEININTDSVIIHDDLDTAIAYVTTDSDGNQITSFYPGVMQKPDKFRPSSRRQYELAVISPEDTDWMNTAIDYCIANKIPYVFDPGQQIPALSKKQLMHGIESAQVVIVNKYEFELIQAKTGLTAKGLIKQVPTFIVTLGSKGSHIYTYGNLFKIGIATPRKVVDPTGCGDAYRAGIVTGMRCGFGWELTGQMAATIASYAVEEFGTQNHYFELEEFNTRLKKNFNAELNLEH